ncbi:thioredoxin-like protein [Angomonas deanei]|uniref:Thioredoxin/Glutaredoxin, putative n=1 Tax=Angomonas deanei TaxID=59799 RepID=S9VSA1_9TRYP|nr:thioredoxin-like protein [Angomonas deanei]EPY43266.1 thioredoxin-like protein [Angomonas deanei]EPY43808.1 thioredoxin-like protein [Angomonas deanei]CAD2214527.1 Thioredoxin/Glutaredoxin, putative [Angomonas deanei]|eukprot:EPY29821.1 thioredoxin-like protein [Angomonas deanei]
MQRVSSTQHYHELKTAAKETLGLVVHFSASWCEPCKEVNSFLEKQAASYGSNLIIAEVNCEVHEEICELEGIESVPFISFFRPKNGELERVADVAGAKLDLITLNLVSLYGEKGGHGVQRKDFADLDDYLKYLTTRKGIVAFITGSPSRPRCGFTGRLCEVLAELKADFVYYDVMADDEVCERLKVYAKWPTYPQVYVDGELIGGWDICKELHEEGELKSTLKI